MKNTSHNFHNSRVKTTTLTSLTEFNCFGVWSSGQLTFCANSERLSLAPFLPIFQSARNRNDAHFCNRGRVCMLLPKFERNTPVWTLRCVRQKRFMENNSCTYGFSEKIMVFFVYTLPPKLVALTRMAFAWSVVRMNFVWQRLLGTPSDSLRWTVGSEELT